MRKSLLRKNQSMDQDRPQIDKKRGKLVSHMYHSKHLKKLHCKHLSVNFLKEGLYCHTVCVCRDSTHLQMAAFEGGTSDDTALFSGPGLSVGVWGTGISHYFCVWAAGWNPPAITKCHCICHRLKGACSEIVFTVAIIVSTQTTDLSLKQTNPKTVECLSFFFHGLCTN